MPNGIVGNIANGAMNVVTNQLKEGVDQAKAVASSAGKKASSAMGIAGAVATGAIVGAIIGEALLPIGGAAIGAVAGGYVAYKIKTISAGTGSVLGGIKALARAAARTVKDIVFLPFTILKFLLYPLYKLGEYMAKVATKALYVGADEIYQKDKALQKLTEPIKDGVAAQAAVIDALVAVTPGGNEKEIRGMVALGERLTQALRIDGNQVRIDPKAPGIEVEGPDGKKVVPSSVYTTRAIAWYARAQDLWSKQLRQPAGAADGSPGADTGALVAQAAATPAEPIFVLSDPNHKIARYIAQAPSRYETEGEVLNRQRDASFAAATPKLITAVDDGRHQLPGGAGRVLVNALEPLPGSGEKRVALQLQTRTSPTWAGQRPEGHEGLGWKAMQLASGVSTRFDALFAEEPAVVAHASSPKAGQLAVQGAIQNAFFSGVANFKAAVDLSREDQAVIDAMKQLPLVTLLSLFEQGRTHLPSDEALGARVFAKALFTDPEGKPLGNAEIGKQIRETAPKVLNHLNDEAYKGLRDAVVAGIKQDGTGSWAAEQAREGDEIVVPTGDPQVIKAKITTDRDDRETGLEALRKATRRPAEVADDKRIAREAEAARRAAERKAEGSRIAEQPSASRPSLAEIAAAADYSPIGIAVDLGQRALGTTLGGAKALAGRVLGLFSRGTPVVAKDKNEHEEVVKVTAKPVAIKDDE